MGMWPTTEELASVRNAQVGVPAAAICVGLAASTTSFVALQGSQHPDHCCQPRLPEPEGQAAGALHASRAHADPYLLLHWYSCETHLKPQVCTWFTCQ